MAKGAASKKGTAAEETQEVKVKKCRPTQSMKKLWNTFEGDLSPAMGGLPTQSQRVSGRAGRAQRTQRA